MVIAKCEDVTKQGLYKLLSRKLRLQGSLLLVLQFQSHCHSSGWGGRLFEAGRLFTFSAYRMGAYSRWALIWGWALIRINTDSLSMGLGFCIPFLSGINNSLSWIPRIIDFMEWCLFLIHDFSNSSILNSWRANKGNHYRDWGLDNGSYLP